MFLNRRSVLCVIAALLLSMLCMNALAVAYDVGDEADDIATIQTALKQLKLYDGSITGHYGQKTADAVMEFQKKHSLTADGIAGTETIKELYKAAGITSSGSSSSSSSSSGVLRYGSESSAVSSLQKDLASLGYYTGSISGHFGTKTETAVMAFQKANGLTPDGVCGSKTLSKIASALSGKSSSSSASASSSSSSILKYGVSSSTVKTLQQNLKTLGYYSGSITGNYGKLTEEAVYNFQKSNGLTADGVAGTKTLNKISAAVASGSGSSSSSSSSSSTKLSTSSVLQEGSNSTEVKKLQKMLKSLGYYSGSITGNYGAKTKAAVQSFQSARGLTADGIAGTKTLAKINSDYANGLAKSSSSSSSGSSLKAKAAKVIYSNFYNWRKKYSNGQYCTVYDYSTGYSWKLRVMSSDAHMDAEPATAEDTAIMNKAFGGKQTWTPKVVWVTFQDGKTYIGATHNTPHGTYHLGTNDFKGHLCVHFPLTMSQAKAIGSYATSHQEAIDAGWAATQKLAE